MPAFGSGSCVHKRNLNPGVCGCWRGAQCPTFCATPEWFGLLPGKKIILKLSHLESVSFVFLWSQNEQPSVRIMSLYLLVSRTWASKVVMLKVPEAVEIHWKNMNIGDKHLAWLELTVCLWTIYNWWGNIPVLDGSQNQRTNPKLLNVCWFFHENCQISENFRKPKTGCSFDCKKLKNLRF
jgi:hypothetical protein